MDKIVSIEMEHTQELLDLARRLYEALAGLHYSESRDAQTVHLTRAIQRHRTLGELLAKADE